MRTMSPIILPIVRVTFTAELYGGDRWNYAQELALHIQIASKQHHDKHHDRLRLATPKHDDDIDNDKGRKERYHSAL